MNSGPFSYMKYSILWACQKVKKDIIFYPANILESYFFYFDNEIFNIYICTVGYFQQDNVLFKRKMAHSFHLLGLIGHFCMWGWCCSFWYIKRCNWVEDGDGCLIFLDWSVLITSTNHCPFSLSNKVPATARKVLLQFTDLNGESLKWYPQEKKKLWNGLIKKKKSLNWLLRNQMSYIIIRRLCLWKIK
jgi:hypothetical protein